MKKQLRNVCFTMNNYNDEKMEHLLQEFVPLCSYCILGLEVGKQKTPHIQGYAELKKRKSFNKIRKLLLNSHIEDRKGSGKQASEYCKKDGNFTEYGELKVQGKRNDLKKFIEDVKNGARNNELIENHSSIMARYYKFANVIRSAACEEKALSIHNKPIEVKVLVGLPGTGKTRYIYDNHKIEDIFRPDLSRNIIWFDGYKGQDVLLLDDFDGQINYSYLLTLLDRYFLNLPIKGGFTHKAWTKVYITSNEHPNEWYSNRDNIDALLRRISIIKK